MLLKILSLYQEKDFIQPELFQRYFSDSQASALETQCYTAPS